MKKQCGLAGGLALSFKPGETVRIGEDIFIGIFQISGGSQVRLIFNCPRDMKISRLQLDESNQGIKPIKQGEVKC